MADSFFSELKRRNVFKVGVAYLVLAWVVVQVTTAAVPALHLPDWVNSLVFFLGTLGFPFALFFAWAFEVTPGGIKKESEITPEDSISSHTGRKLDFIIIGLLVIGMGYFIYESRFQSSPEKILTEADLVETEQQINLAKKPEKTSIAVLPFRDMSEASDQSFMGEGIADELLNALAQEKGLKVIARTSSFAFKNKEMTIAQIGEILSVSHILEGSIRRAGNRIRITAQLINVKSSNHLWSKTYTKDMKDIFALEDEIVGAVHAELLEKLLGKRKNKISHVVNPEALVLYQTVNQLWVSGSMRLDNTLHSQREKLKKAITLDPDFAEPHVLLARLYGLTTGREQDPIPRKEVLKLVGRYLDKALLINSELASAYVLKGDFAQRLSESANAEEKITNYTRAIDINASMSEAYAKRGLMYTYIGQQQKGEQDIERAYSLNPIDVTAVRSMVSMLEGRQAHDKAEQAINLLLQARPKAWYPIIWKIQKLMQADKFREAFEFADGTYKSIGSFLLKHAGVFDISLSDAGNHHYQKDWNKSYAFSVKKLKQFPREFYIRGEKALALMMMDKKEEALVEAKQSLQDFRDYYPEDATTIFRPILLLGALGHPELVQPELERELGRLENYKASRDISALNQAKLGVYYCVMGRYEDCVQELNEALDNGHVTPWPIIDTIPALKTHAGYQAHRKRLDDKQAQIRIDAAHIIEKWRVEIKENEKVSS